jgi:CheY-like chemotaxis protein
MTARGLVALVDVLIAGEDRGGRRGLRQVLEGQGYRCTEARTGPETVELAWRFPPRCVLLDLESPELDGFAVARLLRSDPRTRSARIHGVTGRTDPEVRVAARDAGCELCLTKPVDRTAVLDAVRRPAEVWEPWAVPGLTLGQAEQLLDWMENQGCMHLEITLDEGGVTVHCLRPPWVRVPSAAGEPAS